ncbi:tetratricopeptide repeat protein [Limoniibacter endophyticus]|uniref:Tetratricopeptide repeat protein n=1 Tax=Limoniibacter endophyticus TaxID=1565040 RepID=A0A8J3DQJ9_9HYPH|nr:tetratricopeptide repeat protein [Limoniibacter endophyticus]GHC77050.1 hypothetical protein GCM10010136_28300 [Limoniibacter endophyticus]
MALLISPVSAQQTGQEKRGVSVVAKDQKAELDGLFETLKKTSNPQAAARIAARIRTSLSHSGSETVDLMMGWAQEAVGNQNFGVALDFLDQITIIDPDYAEAYGLRATIYIITQDFEKSKADMRKALSLEPRHPAILAAYAQLLQAEGNKKQALRVLERLLGVYPTAPDAQQAYFDLFNELDGRAI